MCVVQEHLVTVRIVTRTWPNLGISRLDRRYGSVIVAWFEVCRRRAISFLDGISKVAFLRCY
jgi:hypothetical protein